MRTLWVPGCIAGRPGLSHTAALGGAAGRCPRTRRRMMAKHGLKGRRDYRRHRSVAGNRIESRPGAQPAACRFFCPPARTPSPVGRLQLEWVADISPESPANFVGMRTMCWLSWPPCQNPARLRQLSSQRPTERPRQAQGLAPNASLPEVRRGGENRAFGTGLLCGWSEHGTRPAFQLIAHSAITLAASICCGTIIAAQACPQQQPRPRYAITSPWRPFPAPASRLSSPVP
jgi:hypothetical protein